MALAIKTISVQAAQARAAEFLSDNDLARFSVGAPRRMVSPLRSVWSVPIDLRYPNYGLVGEVGVVAIDQETGNVVAWTPREEMLATAAELYHDQREPIEQSRQIEPPNDPRHPLIYQREGAAGYEPAIVGTGVRVRAIVEYSRQYGGNVDQIRESVPEVSPEQVHAALAYYADHTEEIEFFIAENGGDYLDHIMREWNRRRADPNPASE